MYRKKSAIMLEVSCVPLFGAAVTVCTVMVCVVAASVVTATQQEDSSAHRANVGWSAHTGLARRVELFVLAEAKVCNLEDWSDLSRLGLLQPNESVFELQVSMCESLVVYKLHSSHELLKEEKSHGLIKAVHSLHSFEEFPSCGILQHDS